MRSGLLIGLVGALGKLTGGQTHAAILEATRRWCAPCRNCCSFFMLYYAGTAALNALLAVDGLSGPFDINGFVAAVGVLGFVQGAYSTEVLRGAIQAIPVGQIEAARPTACRRARIPAHHRCPPCCLTPFRAVQSLAHRHQGFGARSPSSAIRELALGDAPGGRQHQDLSSPSSSSAGAIYLVDLAGLAAGFGLLERRVRRGQRRSCMSIETAKLIAKIVHPVAARRIIAACSSLADLHCDWSWLHRISAAAGRDLAHLACCRASALASAGHSDRSGPGHRPAVARLARARVLHRHPRHAAADPALAPLLRAGLAVPADPGTAAEFPVAGAARGHFLRHAGLHPELRGL